MSQYCKQLLPTNKTDYNIYIEINLNYLNTFNGL